MQTSKNKSKGFTLIELMVVVAIVGIAGAIAVSSYQDTQRTSRRSVAQGGLEQLAMVMETYYLEHNSNYSEAGDPSVDNHGKPLIFPHLYPTTGKVPYYSLWVLSVTKNTYTLVAVPINSQAGDGLLMLTSTRLKGWDQDNSLNGNTNNLNNLTASELDWNKN